MASSPFVYATLMECYRVNVNGAGFCRYSLTYSHLLVIAAICCVNAGALWRKKGVGLGDGANRHSFQRLPVGCMAERVWCKQYTAKRLDCIARACSP